MLTQDAHVLKKSRSHLKVVGTGRVIWTLHMENPQKSTKIGHNPRKFSCHGDLAPGICTPVC